MTEASSEKKASFVIQHHENRSAPPTIKVDNPSHHLRGPLNSILGFTELLLEGIEGPINEIQAEDLTAIQTSAKNLLQLINTVVDLSKLADDQLRITPEIVDLKAIFESILYEINISKPTKKT